MLREDCSSDSKKNQRYVREQGKKESLQSLEDTEGTESKSRTKHREKAIKERGWPANLRKEKHDNLEDNKQAVDDSPENAANLVGYGAVPVSNVSTQQYIYIKYLNLLNVFAVSQVLRCDIATLLGSFKRVNSFDVCDDDKNTAGKDQYERHDAQETDNIESKENI
jgi:hypothetical protein